MDTTQLSNMTHILLQDVIDRWLATSTTNTTSSTTNKSKYATFYLAWTSVVLALMFLSLIMEWLAPDMAMVSALTLLMTAGAVSINSGIAGFANAGVLTVVALFPLAAGVTHTGALDWYMGRVLGRPRNNIDAQIRLMIPNIILSAFVHNTPLVMAMIPIIQGWSKSTGVNVQQLMMPLSVAAIFGGTTTLLGTTTNIVVTGLLDKNYPNDKSVKIGMFDMGLYGVPLALLGLAYTVLVSPFVLPGGAKYIGCNKNKMGQAESGIKGDDILLGARLTKWSPAAGRSVKRSGLRDTGGIYLVSVYRASTGNVHRAVGQEFVLHVGDILYFTGLVEGFAGFCEDHGLEVVTEEFGDSDVSSSQLQDPEHGEQLSLEADTLLHSDVHSSQLAVSDEIGFTRDSLLQSDENERWRIINHMVDEIRMSGSKDTNEKPSTTANDTYYIGNIHQTAQPARIVIASDHSDDPLIVVAINSPDRPGLLLDLSKAFKRLGLNFRSSEAKVVNGRSLSIWRCDVLNDGVTDLDNIWSVLNALLEADKGVEALKHRGSTVIRAKITAQSSLIGLTVADSAFTEKYKARIVALQQSSRQVKNIAEAIFAVGDLLVLQVTDGSPLLRRPPVDFYQKLAKVSSSSIIKGKSSSLLRSFVRDIEGNPVKKSHSASILVNTSAIDPNNTQSENDTTTDLIIDRAVDDELVWQDLQVLFPSNVDEESDLQPKASREFLTAMTIARKSAFIKKTAEQAGLTHLKGVFLVTIERPRAPEPSPSSSVVNIESTVDTIAITADEALQEGDLLWYSGSAESIHDLKKVPGLQSYVSSEIKKINARVHDRRLVQAVISRHGPLVGKTIKEARFRTKYGAAVLSVNRNGKRVHDQPGNIRLQAGDVLLLEAGPNFIKDNVESDKSFALIFEVKDSAPPRLRLFIPAILLVVAMLAITTADVADLLITTLIAVMIMAAIGIISAEEIRKSIMWDLYVTIASAFGIGNAMSSSGLASAIAKGIVKLSEVVNIGDAGAYGAVYLATFLISQVLTNNAAAALAFPIAMSTAEKYHASRKMMAYVVMFGASASFMTPFGYTTNLLVYGPGGYNTLDYVLFGTPLQLLFWIYTTAILASKNPWLWWIWTGVPVVLLCIIGILGPKFLSRAWSSRRRR